jgi:hypothetical protein
VVELAPQRASIRKDLGYAYLRVGENELAYGQFQEALRLAPEDTQAALEYEVAEERPLACLRLRPYLSLRFIGDTRVIIGAVSTQHLSPSSFIVGNGITTLPWRGITIWAEAGSAMSYVTATGCPITAAASTPLAT